MNHGEFARQLLLAVAQIPGVIVFPHQVGVAKSFDGLRVISYGIPGAADITGIAQCKLSKLGVRLEIECKVGKDELSEDQILYRSMIQAYGGLYIEARNIDETVDMVREYINNH